MVGFQSRFRRRSPLVLAPMLLLGPLALSSCKGPRFDDTQSAVTPPNLPALPVGEAFRVLVIGDHGTGGDGQREVAAAIAATHGEAPPDIAITVGDNFYPSGVASPFDPLWREAFEDVYTGPFWDQFDFYPSLGNHDHYGSVEAQVEYGWDHPRWKMDHRYWTSSFPIPEGGTLRLVTVDTYPLTKDEGDPEQIEFLTQTFSEAANDWILPYGHHPVLEVGLHGEDGDLVDELWELITGASTLYVTGHDHLIAYTGEGDFRQATCGGAGGEDNAHRLSPRGNVEALYTNGGWCFLHVYRDVMAVELYNGIGTLRYRAIVPRRAILDP